jgi:hypothetical protein
MRQDTHDAITTLADQVYATAGKLAAVAAAEGVDPGPPPPPPPPTIPDAKPTLFAPDAAFNQVALGAPVLPESPSIVAKLNAAALVFGTAFAATNSGVPFVIVDDDTPVRYVTLTSTDPAIGRIQQAFAEVPIPDGVEGNTSSDRHLTVYHPTKLTAHGRGVMWDFWRFGWTPDGKPTAKGGARLLGVDESPGHFRKLQDVDDAGKTTAVELTTWGVRAGKTPLMGGTVTIAEVQAGVIPHAVGLVAPARVIANRHVYPAFGHDGMDTDPDALPDGLRLRLRADAPLDGLTPLARMIGQACQVFGAYVVDGGEKVGVYGEVDRVGGQWEPFMDPQHVGRVLDGFPWGYFEAVAPPAGS